MVNYNDTFNENFSRRIWSKILITILLTSISLAIALGLAYIVFHMFIFNGSETIYLFGKMIERNIFWLFVMVGMIVAIIVLWQNWKKSIDYIEVIADAGRQLITADDEFIHLPGELKDIENQMNQVKQDAIRNARLAREAEQRKNDLIVYLAHDLKTPLTSVIGYLTLLRDEQQISAELRKKYLVISLEKAERLEDLINEFFEITRFNLTRLTLELSQVNLTRMLEQIVYEFQPLLAEKNLQCSLQVAPQVEIKCDINKMERVFDNLIRNAISYSYENSTIEIIVDPRPDSLYVLFSNPGGTIAPEKLSRIFEQFYRLDTSRTSKTGGAGLGLAIAKEIIELHHGTIKALSENEKVNFEIILPLLP